MTIYIRIVFAGDRKPVIMAFDDVTIAEANDMADMTRRLIHGWGFSHTTKEEYDKFLADRGNQDSLNVDE